jgi:hypothetical protein
MTHISRVFGSIRCQIISAGVSAPPRELPSLLNTERHLDRGRASMEESVSIAARKSRTWGISTLLT